MTTLVAVYLVPLGAVVALCAGLVAYHRRTLRHHWATILVSFTAPWLLALERGGPQLMFELMTNPTEWGVPTFVWVVPFAGMGLLILGFRYWMRHFRESLENRRKGAQPDREDRR